MNGANRSIDVGERVRLIEPFGGLAAGTVGTVFGFYRRSDELELAVAFGGESRAVPVRLLELVETEDDDDKHR